MLVNLYWKAIESPKGGDSISLKMLCMFSYESAEVLWHDADRQEVRQHKNEEQRRLSLLV